MSKNEIYVSIDIEADGPIPGVNSMLQLGAVTYDYYGSELGTFQVNLYELPGATPDPETMKWWLEKFPQVYGSFAKERVDPAIAMRRFVAWAVAFGRKPTLVGYPAAYDFMFVHWYLRKFTGGSPFGHYAQDIKTMMADLLGIPYREATRSTMPKRWGVSVANDHTALADAREQGQLFFKIRNELRDLRNNYQEALSMLRGGV